MPVQQPPSDAACCGLDARDARQAAARIAIGLLLDEIDLAALFNVSLEQLRKWRKHGLGPRFIRISRRPYYRANDVRDWIASLPLEGPQQPAKQRLRAGSPI
jgi:hypothetical protein